MRPSIMLSFLLITVLSATLFAQCPNIGANDIFSFTHNNHSYEIIKQGANYSDARACAISRGGYLAVIDDAIEQDTVYANAMRANIIEDQTVAPGGGGASYLWLGGNDLRTERDWYWYKGSNDSTLFFRGDVNNGMAINGRYNNWGAEPDDAGNQDGLGLAITDWPLGFAGQWNDLNTERNSLFFIIEKSTTGINSINLEFEGGIRLFPLPTEDLLNLSAKEQITDITIYDITGKHVLSTKFKHASTTQHIDVSALSKGNYTVILTSKTGKQASKPIVKL